MTVDSTWLLGTAGSIITAGIVGYISVTNRLTKLEALVHSDLNERVVVLETMWNVLGNKALKALHSPHTPELDSLIEEYAHFYDLPLDKWNRLETLVMGIEADKASTKGEKCLALLAAALCHHKKMRYSRDELLKKAVETLPKQAQGSGI